MFLDSLFGSPDSGDDLEVFEPEPEPEPMPEPEPEPAPRPDEPGPEDDWVPPSFSSFIAPPKVERYGLSDAQRDEELAKAKRQTIEMLKRRGHLAARKTGGRGITVHPLAAAPMLRKKT